MTPKRPPCVFLSWRNESPYCYKRQIPIKVTLCAVCRMHKPKKPRCRVCGCTDERGCWPDPCWWVEPDLCSNCSDKTGSSSIEPPRAAEKTK